MRPRRAAALLLAAVAVAAPAAAAVAPPAAAEDVTVVCRFDDERLTEISGMAPSLLHPGVLWLHNDSSGGPYLYAVDGTTCQTLARLTVDGIEARDLEGIASGVDAKGRPVLWVGDIGDNLDAWDTVRIHRVREPKELVDATVGSATYEFTYADGAHNAEALLADPYRQRLWVVTKQLATGGLWRLPIPLVRDEVMTAERLGDEGGLVTDGAVAPDASRYVLRDYLDARVYEGLPPGRELARIELPVQPRGEAVAWAADGRALLVAGEMDDRLLRVPLPEEAWTGSAGSGPEGGSGTAAPSTGEPVDASPAGTDPSEPAPGTSPSAASAAAAADDPNRVLWGAALAAGAVGLVALATWRLRT
ncbi:MAG: hypothetical protein R2737_06655 [Candidatus Nanopelagicales bacterium]